MNFNAKFKNLMDTHHRSQSDVARDLGVTQGAIWGYLNSGKRPNSKKWAKIAAYFNVSVQWLFFDEDKSTTQIPSKSHKLKSNSLRFPYIKDWSKIAALTTGEGVSKIREFKMFNIDNKKFGENAFVLTVQDNSMTSNDKSDISIPEGKLIIVDPDVKPEAKDYVCAIHKETGEPTFQQYYIHSGVPHLRTLNRQFPAVKFEDFELVGTVVYVAEEGRSIRQGAFAKDD